jgi:hypothetical protein
MATLFPDTAPDVEAKLLELLRAAPGWRKIEMMGALNRSMRRAVLCGLRERYPEADEEELRRRLAARLYGRELAEKAYGPLVVEDDGSAGSA